MNGTVAPPSSSSTAAATCPVRTPSSPAIFWLTGSTRRVLHGPRPDAILNPFVKFTTTGGNHGHGIGRLRGYHGGRARRRADRGRRAVRHRGRLPAGGRRPRLVVSDPRGPRHQRRNLGPVQVPRRPFRLRHVHAELPVPSLEAVQLDRGRRRDPALPPGDRGGLRGRQADQLSLPRDRKSTRLNSSHVEISYAVFCLKKKEVASILQGIYKKRIEKAAIVG